VTKNLAEIGTDVQFLIEGPALGSMPDRTARVCAEKDWLQLRDAPRFWGQYPTKQQDSYKNQPYQVT